MRKQQSGEMAKDKMATRPDKFSFTMPGAISVLVFRRGTLSRLGAVRFTGQISKSNISSTFRSRDFGHLPATSSLEQRQRTAPKF
jgi:hypothetical protein